MAPLETRPSTPPWRTWLPWALAAVTLIFCALWTLRLAPPSLRLPVFSGPALRAAADHAGHVIGTGWQFPGATLRALLAGLWVLLAVFATGWTLMSRCAALRRAAPLPTERLLLAPLLGFIILSLLVLGLGLVGLTGAGVSVAVLGLMTLAGLPDVPALGRTALSTAGATLKPADPVLRLGTLLVAAVYLFMLLPYALSPAIESDELRYHLAAPAQWLAAGRIEPLRWQAFSFFPMLGEMGFMVALPLGGDGTAHMLHWAMVPLAAGWVALLTRRRQGHPGPAGRWAALMFMTLPFAAIIAAWAFIDLFVAAYGLAFIYIAGRMLDRPRRASGWLPGLLAGGGIAAKYSMVPWLGGLGLLWTVGLALRTRSPARVGRIIAVVALATLLAGGAWYVRNAAWVGNPVYPLGWSVFGGGDWSEANAAFFAAKAAEKGWSPGGINGPVASLAALLASPVTSMTRYDLFEGHYPGPALLVALVLLVAGLVLNPLQPRHRAMRRWLVAALIFGWVFWFATYQSNRFLLVPIGLVLGLGLGSVQPGNALARIVPASVVLFQLGFIVMLMALPNRAGHARLDGALLSYGFGNERHYLAQRLNYWQGAQWLARQAEPGRGALAIGEHRAHHFDLPLVLSDWFDTPQPLPLIRATPDNDALLDRLLERGVTHIFLNAGELALYHDAYFRPRFSPAEYERFTRLMRHPRLERIDPGRFEGILIYRIRPRG